MASQHTYKLYYFDFRGRAELIRLVFAAAAQKFEDVRLTSEQFAALKPTLPYGQVPVLEIDGKMYAQTYAIACYLSKEFGLHGNNNVEALQIEQILQQMRDLEACTATFFYEKNPELREKKKAEVKEKQLPRLLGFFEKPLENTSSPSGYFVGDELTLADIAICELISSLTSFGLLDVENYPHLKAHTQRVENHPKLVQYYKERGPDKYIMHK